MGTSGGPVVCGIEGPINALEIVHCLMSVWCVCVYMHNIYIYTHIEVTVDLKLCLLLHC